MVRSSESTRRKTQKKKSAAKHALTPKAKAATRAKTSKRADIEKDGASEEIATRSHNLGSKRSESNGLPSPPGKGTNGKRSIVQNEDSITEYNQSIEEIYNHAITKGSSRAQRDFFEKLEESGIIERRLWPLLANSIIAHHINDFDEKKGTDKYESRYAILFAILVNRKATNGNTAAGNSPLEFINHHDYIASCNTEEKTTLEKKLGEDKDGNLDQTKLQEDAFVTLICDVLSYFLDSTSNSTSTTDIYNYTAYNLQSECIQFLTHCYASIDVSTIISNTMLRLSGLPLWEAMNSRRLVMELEKCPPLKLLWTRRKKEQSTFDQETSAQKEQETGKGGTGKKRKQIKAKSAKNKKKKTDIESNLPIKKKSLDKFESTFIPTLVSKFLETLRLLDDVNIDSAESENDESDEDNEIEDDQNRQSSKFVFPGASVTFLHTVLVFFVDLLSIPSIRRFLQPYLLSTSLTVHCGLSDFFSDNRFSKKDKNHMHPKIKLFQQLLEILIEVENFPMDNYSSKPLSNAEIQKQVHARCHALQQICFKYFIGSASNASSENGTSNVINPKMLDFVYAGVAYACQEQFLRTHLGRLDTNDLLKLAHILRLVDRKSDQKEALLLLNMSDEKKRIFLISLLVYRHAIRPSEAITLSQLPLYPSEEILWDENTLPNGRLYGGSGSSKILALPKLNTQFLTFGDYLLRSFKLMRLESAYGIRGDIVDAVRRSNPVVHHDYSEANAEENEYYGIAEDDNKTPLNDDNINTTSFNGWARMAIEIKDFGITKIAKPRLGETVPAKVLGDITIDLEPLGTQIRKEWDEIGEFDNLFLISIDAGKMTGEQAPLQNKWSDRRVPDEEDVTFPFRYGVMAVRGCMVYEVKDEAGTLLNDPAVHWENKDKGESDQNKPKGTKRFIKVALDPAQYAKDANNGKSGRVYESFNLLIRRHGRENNFKAVLETIRDLMYTSTQGMVIHKTIPPWLHNVLLGYGDPSSAKYSSRTMRAYAERTVGVTHPDAALDYGDTFLDENHLSESFPDYSIVIDGKKDKKEDVKTSRKNFRIQIVEKSNSIKAVSYPFLKSKVKGNPIRFTPVQVEAVRSGLSPGLTLIVGPPGTGKTDVAVQIIANLYHSFPTQRTVIVTHSNAALNDLFEKVMERGDIDERYLLRLGSGERDLKTSSLHDFTKLGRVGHILSRRGELLEKVQLLSESLGVSRPSERGPDGSPSYTCETASYFNLHHVQKRIQIFYSTVNDLENVANLDVQSIFPFKEYFTLNSGDSHLSLSEAKDKFDAINQIFTELVEYRPLELLRSQRQRSDYLLTKQARIVAMTCTHAAIARSHLRDVGFQYDNILMEEAGQMLEVETFVPMLLQRSVTEEESSLCRLKRICLIGDHNQLPPVVKNLAFSKYSHLDQSLFSRLIRLGVPSILLNKQGRARADIARLYSWRYKGLGNLAHINSLPAFQMSNAGFLHHFQMINVEDFEGRGESTPSPYFYQNLGEAEYAVALFQYMILIGYPPEKISILTTYNGQKQLIQDIISQRCAPRTPLAGVAPGAISTVDQYQGQQNDYIILSLVRTASVGYLRDVRRLIVAVSRARLGLYVLGRQRLFNECHELCGIMNQFREKSNKLQIITGEHYPSTRKSDEEVALEKIYEVEDVIDFGGVVFTMQEQLCSD